MTANSADRAAEFLALIAGRDRLEPGKRYSELEVNAVRAFHADTAALRRYLVDEGMLTREAAVYWRSGGTVLLD